MIAMIFFLAQAGDTLSILIEKALKESLSSGLLVAGIYAVSRLMLKAQDRANLVQDQRIQDLKEHVVALQKQCKDCETDRQRLWSRLAEIDPNIPYAPKAPPTPIS